MPRTPSAPAAPVTEGTGLLDAMALAQTTDASVWAEQFALIYPGVERPDRDALLGWFANAIEAGRAAGEAVTAANHDIANAASAVVSGFQRGKMQPDYMRSARMIEAVDRLERALRPRTIVDPREA